MTATDKVVITISGRLNTAIEIESTPEIDIEEINSLTSYVIPAIRAWEADGEVAGGLSER